MTELREYAGRGGHRLLAMTRLKEWKSALWIRSLCSQLSLMSAASGSVACERIRRENVKYENFMGHKISNQAWICSMDH